MRCPDPSTEARCEPFPKSIECGVWDEMAEAWEGDHPFAMIINQIISRPLGYCESGPCMEREMRLSHVHACPPCHAFTGGSAENKDR